MESEPSWRRRFPAPAFFSCPPVCSVFHSFFCLHSLFHHMAVVVLCTVYIAVLHWDQALLWVRSSMNGGGKVVFHTRIFRSRAWSQCCCLNHVVADFPGRAMTTLLMRHVVVSPDPSGPQPFECVNVLLHLRKLLDVGVQMWTDRFIRCYFFVHTGGSARDLTHVCRFRFFYETLHGYGDWSACFNGVKGRLCQHSDAMHRDKLFLRTRLNIITSQRACLDSWLYNLVQCVIATPGIFLRKVISVFGLYFTLILNFTP